MKGADFFLKMKRPKSLLTKGTSLERTLMDKAAEGKLESGWADIVEKEEEEKKIEEGKKEEKKEEAEKDLVAGASELLIAPRQFVPDDIIWQIVTDQAQVLFALANPVPQPILRVIRILRGISHEMVCLRFHQIEKSYFQEVHPFWGIFFAYQPRACIYFNLGKCNRNGRSPCQFVHLCVLCGNPHTSYKRNLQCPVFPLLQKVLPAFF